MHGTLLRATAAEATRARLRWHSPPVVLGLIGLYLALHFVTRLALGPTLGLDDAEQALFAQAWSWGYRSRQPPLFTWALVPASEVLGLVPALALFRTLLLGATYVGIYLVARRWIADQRLAALAVFSFALIYVFAYYAHHDLTHTTTLGAAIALTFWLLARLLERPSTQGYVLLGVCAGLGVLGKWNYVMLAAGLVLGCLLLPRYRHLVLGWRALLAAALAGLIVAPTALFLLRHGSTVSGISEDILAVPEPQAALAVMLEGTLALARAALGFPQPFLVVFLAVFGSALVRSYRDGTPPAAGRAPLAFLATVMALTLGLHWLLVPAVGAVTFTERWMHPALMILPVFLFALAERGRPSRRAIGIYLTIVVLAVAGAFGARAGRYAMGADHCGKCRELVPFETLAGELAQAGFTGGTIVVPPDEFHIGGNLRVQFPESRVLDPAYPPEIFPPPVGHGQCLAVWDAGRPDALTQRASIEAYLEGVLAVPGDAAWRTGEVDALMTGSSTRRYRLGYALLAASAGTCR